MSKIITFSLIIGLIIIVLLSLTFSNMGIVSRTIPVKVTDTTQKIENGTLNGSEYAWDEEIGAYVPPIALSSEQRDASIAVLDMENRQRDCLFNLKKVEKINDCKHCYSVSIIDRETKEEKETKIGLDISSSKKPVELVTFPENEINQFKAKPTGKTNVSVDLDGDGIPENIYVLINNEFSEINVNNQKIKVYFTAFNYAITDINLYDTHKEVMLFNPGPSNDDSGFFLGYKDGKIYKMGNPGRWPSFNTKGEVSTCIWQGFWCQTETYKLDALNMRLVKQPPVNTFSIDTSSIATGSFDIYKDQELSVKIKTIKEDQFFKVLSVYIDEENQHIYRIEADGITGWVGEDFLGASGISPAD